MFKIQSDKTHREPNLMSNGYHTEMPMTFVVRGHADDYGDTFYGFSNGNGCGDGQYYRRDGTENWEE